MKKIYTSFSRKVSLLSLSLGLFSAVAFAQTPICGPIAENFNNTGGGTAGFAGDFSYDASGQKLIRRNIIGTAVYSITTPTYQLANDATSIGYGFILDGTEQVARVEVVIMYMSTLTNQMTTIFLAQFVPNYGSTTSATVCRAVSTADLPGFPTGGKYRFRIDVTSNTGSGQGNQTVTFDDFRTNGTLSLAPLPVTFVGFDARKVATGTQLTWKVAGEENVNRYEVERSLDGRNFATVASVPVTKLTTYNYLDQSSAGTVYYRVRNVDNDGKFHYTNILRMANGQLSFLIKAFPQPVTNQLTVQHPPLAKNGLLTISSADGRQISSVRAIAGSLQTYVDMSGLQKGLYIIRFNDGENTTEAMKVVKQ